MKLAFTVGDYGAYIHTGSPVEYTTFIVDVPDENIPAKLKPFLKSRDSSFVISTVNEEPKDSQ